MEPVDKHRFRWTPKAMLINKYAYWKRETIIPKMYFVLKVQDISNLVITSRWVPFIIYVISKFTESFQINLIKCWANVAKICSKYVHQLLIKQKSDYKLYTKGNFSPVNKHNSLLQPMQMLVYKFMHNSLLPRRWTRNLMLIQRLCLFIVCLSTGSTVRGVLTGFEHFLTGFCYFITLCCSARGPGRKPLGLKAIGHKRQPHTCPSWCPCTTTCLS